MATLAEVQAYIDSLTTKNLYGYISALQLRENDSSYSSDTGQYIGAYQFSLDGLRDAGLVESAKDFPNQAENDATTWVWTGQNGVDSLDAFLGRGEYSAEQAAINQDVALIYLIKKLWYYFRHTSLEQYGDQTLNDTALSVSGLVAGAHLVGNTSIRNRFIATGGLGDPIDGNGTPASQYIKLFSGFDFTDTSGLSSAVLAQLPTGFADYFVTHPELGVLLKGGAGADTLLGFDANDTVLGGTGDREIVAGDSLDGGDGEADLLNYEYYSSFSRAVRVDVAITGHDTFDTVYAISDRDDPSAWTDSAVRFEQIRLTAQDDLVDFIYSPGFIDLNDEPGDGRQGNSHLDGGDGVDSIDFSQSDTAIRIDLTDSSLSDVVLVEFENVAGTQHNDTIRGSEVANQIVGQDGNDIILGEAGNDTLSGDLGDDYLFGGTGDDFLIEYLEQEVTGPEMPYYGGLVHLSAFDGGAGVDTYVAGGLKIGHIGGELAAIETGNGGALVALNTEHLITENADFSAAEEAIFVDWTNAVLISTRNWAGQARSFH